MEKTQQRKNEEKGPRTRTRSTSSSFDFREVHETNFPAQQPFEGIE